MNLDGEGTRSALRTWGAIFIEVGVDRDFGLIRLRRAVGVYSAGRILNPMTARAQMIGGIIWGWGKATLEASDQEPVHGRWLAKNLSNVAVPVNADIPAALDVSFIDEYDDAASVIGARGSGSWAQQAWTPRWRPPCTTPWACGFASCPFCPGRCLSD